MKLYMSSLTIVQLFLIVWQMASKDLSSGNFHSFPTSCYAPLTERNPVTLKTFLIAILNAPHISLSLQRAIKPWDSLSSLLIPPLCPLLIITWLLVKTMIKVQHLDRNNPNDHYTVAKSYGTNLQVQRSVLYLLNLYSIKKRILLVVKPMPSG